ncbi:Lsr2 family protein [Streptomyces sp. NPDC050485]|uniref:Lsr2 family protein n=1 Tax=Streptomyces sp. NPDC050485 TaxID=3365617 RepID=UPI003795F612
MAQKIVTIYTDDLTGEESEEAKTHSIAIDGIVYEIDLGPDSYDKLMEAVGPFIGKARKAGRIGKGAKPRGTGSSASGDTAKIRAWAKENGYEVNDRGRVPADIREAFQKASK